jgi:hypothetical protein
MYEKFGKWTWTLESFGISNIVPPKILWENSHIFIETFGKLPPFI